MTTRVLSERITAEGLATRPWASSPARCFDGDPARRAIARALYAQVRDLPIFAPTATCRPRC